MPTVIQGSLEGKKNRTLKKSLATAIKSHLNFPMLGHSFEHLLLALKDLPNVELEINGVPTPYTPEIQQEIDAIQGIITSTFLHNTAPKLFINRNQRANPLAVPVNRNWQEVLENIIPGIISNSASVDEQFAQIQEKITQVFTPEDLTSMVPYLVKYLFNKGEKAQGLNAIRSFELADKILTFYGDSNILWALNRFIILENAAIEYKNLDDNIQAFKLADLAHQSLGRLYGEECPQFVDIEILAANICVDLHEYEVAIAIYNSAYNRAKRIQGAQAIIGSIEEKVADIYTEQGENKKAISMYRQAISTYEKNNLTQHLSSPAFVKIGQLHVRNGNNPLALVAYKKALVASMKTLGQKHMTVASYAELIAEFCLSLEMYEESDKHFKLSYKILKENLGPSHLLSGLLLKNAATVYVEQEKFDKALEMLNHSLNIIQSTEPSHVEKGSIHHEMGIIYFIKREYSTAQMHLNEAYHSRHFHFGLDHVLTQETLQAQLELKQYIDPSNASLGINGFEEAPIRSYLSNTVVHVWSAYGHAECDSMDANYLQDSKPSNPPDSSQSYTPYRNNSH